MPFIGLVDNRLWHEASVEWDRDSVSVVMF